MQSTHASAAAKPTSRTSSVPTSTRSTTITSTSIAAGGPSGSSATHLTLPVVEAPAAMSVYAIGMQKRALVLALVAFVAIEAILIRRAVATHTLESAIAQLR